MSALDTQPREILAAIFSYFPPLDMSWLALMRVNRQIHTIAAAVHAALPTPPLREIIKRDAVDYYLRIWGDDERNILRFREYGLLLSPRHFRIILRFDTITLDAFARVVRYNPALMLIAWTAQLEDGSAGNVNRWLTTGGGQDFYLHPETVGLTIGIIGRGWGTDQYITKRFTAASPDVIRCSLINCIPYVDPDPFTAVLFIARIEQRDLLSDDLLSVLMNYAAVLVRYSIIDVINEFVRLDESGELVEYFEKAGAVVRHFPRYDSSWINGALESVQRQGLDRATISSVRAQVGGIPSHAVRDRVCARIEQVIIATRL